MTLTLDAPMHSANQNSATALGIAQKALRAALLEVAGALKCRPDPRGAWDDLGRTDATTRSTWIDMDVVMCRQALAAAEKEGPGVLAATAQRVERYFAQRQAIALHGYEVLAPASLSASILSMTHETSDVVCAGAEALADHSEGRLEQLREQAIEAERAIEDVIEVSSTQLAERQQRRVMNR